MGIKDTQRNVHSDLGHDLRRDISDSPQGREDSRALFDRHEGFSRGIDSVDRPLESSNLIQSDTAQTGFTDGTPGISDITIMTSGTYDITADGAQGGSFDDGRRTGGAGAAVGGDVYLQKGTILEIVVGGAGVQESAAGGGGGSFVIETYNGTTSLDTILAVAGGGGGAGSNGDGGGGRATSTGGNGGRGGAGGVHDAPGQGGGGGGGGGGGFTGGDGSQLGNVAAASGAMRGTTFSGADDGGFGGGGGSGFSGGGGGGGGYGGGGGGNVGGGGGGGGSYLDSSVTAGTETAAVHTGDGFVNIALVPEIQTPAGGYSAEVVENQQISGGTGAAIAGDTDSGGGTLVVQSVSSSQGIVMAGSLLLGDYGQLTLNADGSYTYTASNSAAIDAAPAGPLVDKFSFNLTDGSGGAARENFDITIDRPPALSNGTTVDYKGPEGAVKIDPGISLSDPDGDPITGATIDIGGGFLAGDQLGFSNQNGITGLYNQATGELSLSGTASSGAYQTALQSIVFSSSDQDPDENGADTSRTIDFTVNEQSATGTTIGSNTLQSQIDVAVCYVAGTRILTASGEVAVETLQVGDMLVTTSGAHRPVRWLGSRRVDCARHPEPSAVWPIRIQAGAFAPNVPARDLWVSPGHSIFVEGVLIQAEKLVNGATLVQVPLASVEYWHVELDSHDVILAEGLAAESYLDTGNRAAFFKNGSSHLQAHPDFRPKHWAETCVPLIFEGAPLEKARLDLRERALALGFVLTDDPGVHIVVDGQRVDPLRLGAERVAFMLPAGGANIELRSRTFTPAHIIHGSTDFRNLGLDVFRVQIDTEVALNDETRLSEGWHGLEEGFQHRWTRGRLPLPSGTRLVVIDLHPQGAVYWREPAVAVAGVVQNRSAILSNSVSSSTHPAPPK